VTITSDIRVLVVEDDEAFRRILEKRIAAEGYIVATANDGREGMRAIVTFDPHLVLSDWMMPHVDGLELCQSVKVGLKEDAPYFILLSAKGDVSERILGLETGADDYLVKPCDPAEILARVRAGSRIVTLARALRTADAEVAALRVEAEAHTAEIERLNRASAACPQCGEGSRARPERHKSPASDAA